MTIEHGAIETLCWGYGLIEGPRVDTDGNLFFSDVINGGVFRRSPDGEVTTAIPKRRGIGGIVFHADGGLVVGGKNIQHVNDGEIRVLYENPPDRKGFNDMHTDAEGRIYVGTFGTGPFDTLEGAEPVDGECIRIDAPGSATVMYEGITITNGIGFSPDGQTVYHADTGKQQIVSHRLSADGTWGGRFALCEGEDFFPDGLAVATDGSVWVADFRAGCVRAISADGEQLGTIPVASKSVTSLCFGGADNRDLYIVTADNTDDEERGGTVFRTRVDVAGVPTPLATV